MIWVNKDVEDHEKELNVKSSQQDKKSERERDRGKWKEEKGKGVIRII